MIINAMGGVGEVDRQGLPNISPG